jgi:ATP-dependent Clp protease, protease subunit
MSWFDIFRHKTGPKETPESKSEKASEIKDKLLEDRIVFLGTPIDDAAAEDVIARFLYLEHKSPREDINFYINSPGGSITASFAIYDTIKSITPDVATICVGQAGGTAAILAASGTKGKRFALVSSRFLIFAVRADRKIDSMSETDEITYLKEIERMKHLVADTLIKETGQSPAAIRSAMRGDLILPADKAIEFGLVDEIVRRDNKLNF